MTDRDHFAAAALTGLLAGSEHNRDTDALDHAATAYYIADAMLRERERTNHDAAPAARAPEPEPSAARRRPAGGTGDTQAPVDAADWLRLAVARGAIQIAKLEAEIERLRLTDDERSIVQACVELAEKAGITKAADTLRALLERLG